MAVNPPAVGTPGQAGMVHHCSMASRGIGNYLNAVIWCENNLPGGAWMVQGPVFWFRCREHQVLFGLAWLMDGDDPSPAS